MATWLYRWQGVGQPSPPCAYREGATIYDLRGKATHVVRGAVGYSVDDPLVPALNVVDNWLRALGRRSRRDVRGLEVTRRPSSGYR
jgi:hypothetical protein